jgi:hypothetical protein
VSENNHRYTLRRSWIGNGGVVNFIMLNPSTADDQFDDATIRRCVGFAKRWGFCGIVVTNLFAYRATQPKDLKALLMTERGFRLGIGERSAEHLDREARMAHIVVCAWGDNVESMPEYIGRRDRDVMGMLNYRDLYCIRLSARGNPVHPVREPYTDAPVKFREATA